MTYTVEMERMGAIMCARWNYNFDDLAKLKPNDISRREQILGSVDSAKNLEEDRNWRVTV